MEPLTFDEVSQLWIDEGYKISKTIGDFRKKDLEQRKKNGQTLAPEIPIEEV
jgi:hypothetical protein